MCTLKLGHSIWNRPTCELEGSGTNIILLFVKPFMFFHVYDNIYRGFRGVPGDPGWGSDF